jgi:hypothetical protein
MDQNRNGVNGEASDQFVDMIWNGMSDTLNVTGVPTSVVAGTAQAVTITALNPAGGIDTTYRGTVHFTSSDSQSVLPANYTFTAADAGAHTFAITLKTAGTQWVAATDTTTASITGSETGIAVQGAAVQSLVVSGFPSTCVAGASGQVTVSALDAYGNPAPGYAGTVHFTSSDPHALLPAD